MWLIPAAYVESMDFQQQYAGRIVAHVACHIGFKILDPMPDPCPIRMLSMPCTLKAGFASVGLYEVTIPEMIINRIVMDSSPRISIGGPWNQPDISWDVDLTTESTKEPEDLYRLIRHHDPIKMLFEEMDS